MSIAHHLAEIEHKNDKSKYCQYFSASYIHNLHILFLLKHFGIYLLNSVYILCLNSVLKIHLDINIVYIRGKDHEQPCVNVESLCEVLCK